MVKNPQEKQEIQVRSQEVIVLDCFWLWVLDNSVRRSSLMISLARILELSRWLSGQESAWQCRRHERPRFDPWVGRSPGEGHRNPLQYSCLENPMDRGAWPTTVHRVTQSRTRLKQLSMQHCPKLQVKNPQVHRNYFCFSCANTIKFSRLQYSSYVVFQSRLAFLYTPTKNSIISVS